MTLTKSTNSLKSMLPSPSKSTSLIHCSRSLCGTMIWSLDRCLSSSEEEMTPLLSMSMSLNIEVTCSSSWSSPIRAPCTPILSMSFRPKSFFAPSSVFRAARGMSCAAPSRRASTSLVRAWHSLRAALSALASREGLVSAMSSTRREALPSASTPPCSSSIAILTTRVLESYSKASAFGGCAPSCICTDFMNSHSSTLRRWSASKSLRLPSRDIHSKISLPDSIPCSILPSDADAACTRSRACSASATASLLLIDLRLLLCLSSCAFSGVSTNLAIPPSSPEGALGPRAPPRRDFPW
mmetsp:Transcript_41588/g.103927  ORF Transcript_41588/g.103927 Transcript_41588/m.103927 type:complete len:297 (-) Transcript_41588:264-1154(-)